MSQIGNWVKGITFSLFMAIVFYFYWDNIFLTLINFADSMNLGIGDMAASLGILKTFAWINFIMLYLACVPIFLIYSIINAGNETKPLEILKGVGIWCVTMPVMVFIYVIAAALIHAVSGANLITGAEATLAKQLSWLISLIIIIMFNFFPFIFITKGYGVSY